MPVRLGPRKMRNAISLYTTETHDMESILGVGDDALLSCCTGRILASLRSDYIRRFQASTVIPHPPASASWVLRWKACLPHSVSIWQFISQGKFIIWKLEWSVEHPGSRGRRISECSTSAWSIQQDLVQPKLSCKPLYQKTKPNKQKSPTIPLTQQRSTHACGKYRYGKYIT